MKSAAGWKHEHLRMLRQHVVEHRGGRAEEANGNGDPGKNDRAQNENVFHDAGPGGATQSGAVDEEREHDEADADRNGGIVHAVAGDAKENLQSAELKRNV